MAIPETPLTRLEQYLNRIATGDGAVPNVPLTRMEQYLNRIATNDGAIPETPLTRTEQYLNKIATGEGIIPNVPLTRSEQYLAKIAGQDTTVPEVPLTRMEQYLAEISENGGGGVILPPEYQQVQYIGRTTISPYISVNLSIDRPYNMRVVVSHDNTTYGRGVIFIGRMTRSNANDDFGVGFEDGNVVTVGAYTNVQILHVEETDGVFTVDISNNVPYAPSVFTLFQYHASAYFNRFIGKIYSVVLEKDGDCMANFVPCYRKSDGEIGMYDTVTETFFTNAGTGAFTKGDDVT